MAPTPKRSFFPFFLLFSLSGLFLYSLYLSSSSTTSTTHLQSPPYHPPPKYNDNEFTLTIKVLTFDRIASLSRCLRSLANAQYGGDRVNLHIFVDHFKNVDPNDKGFVSLDAKLNESRQILDFVDGFSWVFGEKLVHYRTGNVGLQAQWLEAWWPSSDHEFAFVVEDDLEVSPLYYNFLKELIVNYYYNASNFSPSIYGASLQRPRFVPGKHGNKLVLDSDTHLFLYQLVGTWGQLLFPRPWKEFRLWYDTHKTKGIKPFLDGMVTTGWYKKLGERIWTPWFIKFIHSRGYFNLYTSFSHERALSTSHRDAGVNYGKTAGPDSSLVNETFPDFNLLEMQPLRNLKWYDFCFREVNPNRVVRSFDELGYVLPSVERQGTIIFVSLAGVSEPVARNLLCHFERLNIRNYILVGPSSEFLLDLARRGHPVIDVEQFFETIPTSKSVEFGESRMEFIKDIVVNAYVVKKSLELKYNTWVFDGNVLPITGDLFLDSIDPNYDVYIGKTLGLVAIRSSKKNWMENFLQKFASTLKSSDGKDMLQRSFTYTVAQVLGNLGLRSKNIDDTRLGVIISTSDVNQTTPLEGKKIVLWSSEMDLGLIQKRLKEWGLWIIDGDSSCTAVYCHKS